MLKTSTGKNPVRRRVGHEAGTGTLVARLVLVAGKDELPRVLIRGRALAVTQQTIVVQSGNRERFHPWFSPALDLTVMTQCIIMGP